MLNNQTYNTDYCTRCQDTITGLQDRQKENTEFSFVLALEVRKLTFHIALIKVCTLRVPLRWNSFESCMALQATGGGISEVRKQITSLDVKRLA